MRRFRSSICGTTNVNNNKRIAVTAITITERKYRVIYICCCCCNSLHDAKNVIFFATGLFYGTFTLYICIDPQTAVFFWKMNAKIRSRNLEISRALSYAAPLPPLPRPHPATGVLQFLICLHYYLRHSSASVVTSPYSNYSVIAVRLNDEYKIGIPARKRIR